MQACDLILDDEGCLWHSPFFELAEALRSCQTGTKLANYVIKNLGFVRFRLRPYGLVIAFSPKLTLPQTIVRAIYLLSDLPCQRIVLSSLDANWQNCLCGERTEAIEKLLVVLNGRSAKAAAPNYLRNRIDVSKMSRDSPFARVLMFWSNQPAALKQEYVDSIVGGHLRGRYVVVAPKGDRKTLVVEQWGDRLGSYHPKWASRARGMRFQDQPDYRYGCAAADGYMAVLRQRQPILEQVDAIMSKPRSAELRIRYSRLIVPFRGPDGKTRLLSTSLMDPTIDLRKGVHVG